MISALFKILHLNTKCTHMGSSSLPTSTRELNDFKIKKDPYGLSNTWETRHNKFLAKIWGNSSKNQCENDQEDLPHIIVPIIQGQGSCKYFPVVDSKYIQDHIHKEKANVKR